MLIFHSILVFQSYPLKNKNIIKSGIWITWHLQVRSQNLAKALNLEIYEYFRNDNIFLRHLFSTLWTIKLLYLKKPNIIFIQYSYLLLIVILFYKKLFNRQAILVVDCHTKALRRRVEGIFSKIFWVLKQISFYAANLTIISNEGLIKDIKKLHDKYIILPDKIPTLIPVKSDISNNRNYCVYISSFAVDEPLEVMLKVSKLLNNSLVLYWTGRIPKKFENIISEYNNIIFTDYLSLEDYYSLIGNAQCLIALTVEEDCLQSGAYEAISLEVPVVLSDTVSLKSFFGSAAVYTKHEPKLVINAINKAVKSREILQNEMLKLKNIRNIEFEQKIEEIRKFINAK